MKETPKQLVLMLVISSAAAGAVWAALRFTAPRLRAIRASLTATSPLAARDEGERWNEAVEKVKEERKDPADGAAIEVPSELRHYEDRHWFLATQVAEVHQHNVHNCQDFVDLAAMIERGEFVSVPLVADDYVLFGVGAKADDGPFDRFQDDQEVPLYDEANLRDAYSRIDTTHSRLQNEISDLQKQLGSVKQNERAKQRDLRQQISTRQQELKAADDEKKLLDQFYSQADSRQRLFDEYKSLQTLAKDFAGRSYNLDDASDRQAMKLAMLRSIRPQALKILEEVASDYHRQYDRPLPISSLVRPEQYQHALHKVNRNAVVIETPPHSTGLAFDIDYRYMSGAEQNFLMTELARMKDAGRIEVIRERNANYHVFAFVDGRRPPDDLIKASLEEAGAPPEDAKADEKTPAKTNSKTAKTKQKPAQSSAKKGKRRKR